MPFKKVKKPSKEKPKPPTVKFGDIADEVKEYFYDNIRTELLTEYKAHGKLFVETKKEKLNKSLIVLETERFVALMII